MMLALTIAHVLAMADDARNPPQTNTNDSSKIYSKYDHLYFLPTGMKQGFIIKATSVNMTHTPLWIKNKHTKTTKGFWFRRNSER